MSNNPYNSTEDHGKSLFEKAADIVRAGLKTPDQVQAEQAKDHAKRRADRVLAMQKEFARKEPRITDEQVSEFLMVKDDYLGWIMDSIGQHASGLELCNAIHGSDETWIGRIVLNAVRKEILPAMAKEL
jgi:hypothetical protein